MQQCEWHIRNAFADAREQQKMATVSGMIETSRASKVCLIDFATVRGCVSKSEAAIPAMHIKKIARRAQANLANLTADILSFWHTLPIFSRSFGRVIKIKCCPFIHDSELSNDFTAFDSLLANR